MTRPSAVIVLALLCAGCGSSAGSTPPASTRAATPAPPSSGTVPITMKVLAFQPSAAHAGVGQTVVWTNEDNLPHNVIYVSGPKFTSSRPRIRNGTTFSIKL